MCLGVPGRIVERGPLEQGLLATGLVEFAGLRRQVVLELVPEAALDDYVVVHAGIAISRLDQEEAERLLEHLRALGEAEFPTESAP